MTSLRALACAFAIFVGFVGVRQPRPLAGFVRLD